MKIFISVAGDFRSISSLPKIFLEISLNFLPAAIFGRRETCLKQTVIKISRRRSKKIGNACWLHKTHQPKEKRWTESLRNYHLSEINLRSIVKFNWSASFSSCSKPDSAACLRRWLNASEANGNKKHSDDYKLKMQPNCCTWSRSGAKSIFVIYDHLANRIRHAGRWTAE